MIFLSLVFLLGHVFSNDDTTYSSFSLKKIEAQRSRLEANDNIKYLVKETNEKVSLRGIYFGPYKSSDEAEASLNIFKNAGVSSSRIVTIRNLSYVFLTSLVDEEKIPNFRRYILKLKEKHSLSGNIRITRPKEKTMTKYHLVKVDSPAKSSLAWTQRGQLYLATGIFTNEDGSSSVADLKHNIQVIPKDWLEIKLGARFKYYLDDQNSVRTNSRNIFFDDSLLAIKGEKSQLSLGNQYISWGRVFEGSPVDLMANLDFSRSIIDELEKRKLPQTALRYEYFFDSSKLDLVYIHDYQFTEVAAVGSPWHPIRPAEGYILGAKKQPALIPFLSNINTNTSPPRDAAYGARFSHNAGNLDWGLTYIKNPVFSPLPLNESILSENFGIDLNREALNIMWRAEFAYQKNNLFFLTDYSAVKRDTYRYATSVEFFPGDKDVQVNLQLSGFIGQLEGGETALIDETGHSINGQILDIWFNGKLEPRLRLSLGLTKKDVYINPEIRFLHHQPHIFSLAYHDFSGAEDSLGGFYDDNDLLSLSYQFSW